MSVPQAEATTGSAGRIPAGAARVDRDAALVEGLRKGDPTATELLLDTYGDRVYRLAIRITGNEQDAEEVVQDALWTAARKIGMFKGESAFGSWVYRITANTAYQNAMQHSDKQNAAPTFKRGFGFHPLCSFADHGAQGTGEPLSIMYDCTFMSIECTAALPALYLPWLKRFTA